MASLAVWNTHALDGGGCEGYLVVVLCADFVSHEPEFSLPFSVDFFSLDQPRRNISQLSLRH